MKKTIILCFAMTAFAVSCSNSAQEEQYKNETLEMDSIQEEVEGTVEELNESTENLNAEVDSSLKDI